jgi:poly(hydroxyalkanoate) granule-associated protein
MAQAQAQAREQGSKAFEALVAEGLAFQKKSQAAAQEKIQEAAAHFNQLTQNLGAGLVQPVGAKVDRLEHLFEDRVARALKSLGLPTAQEVAELQDRVAVLEAALANANANAKANAKAKVKAKANAKSPARKRVTPAK